MDVGKHCERAQEAIRKKNFDYAIALYQQVLAVKPDHGQARKELRQALARRFEYIKTSPLILKVLGLPQILGLGIGMLTRNRVAMIRACERYLKIEPLNVRMNLILGNALQDAGYLNSAVAVFEFVVEIEAKNIQAMKQAGLLKYQLRDITGALALYEKVLSLNPRDAEAEKMRKNLSAEDTLKSGAYTSARSSRELVKEKDEAAHLQREIRIHKTDEEIEEEIAHFKQLISREPDNKRAHRDLSSLYIRKKDYPSARVALEELLALEPYSFAIRCAIGDLDIKVYSETIEAQETVCQDSGSEEQKAALATLRQEKLTKQVEEFAWRVKAHPTDLKLWYEYGRFLFQAEEIDQALDAFQHAVKDPRYKIQSLHMLGKSFLIKGLFDLAEKQLVNALERSGGVSEKNKAIVYDLGRVAEQTDKLEEALDWYLKIFEIDIHYRDIAAKIEKLQKE